MKKKISTIADDIHSAASHSRWYVRYKVCSALAVLSPRILPLNGGYWPPVYVFIFSLQKFEVQFLSCNEQTMKMSNKFTVKVDFTRYHCSLRQHLCGEHFSCCPPVENKWTTNMVNCSQSHVYGVSFWTTGWNSTLITACANIGGASIANDEWLGKLWAMRASSKFHKNQLFCLQSFYHRPQESSHIGCDVPDFCVIFVFIIIFTVYF